MPRYNSAFSPADVDEIRRQAFERILDVRAWATARRVSMETVRRVARGDTYRNPEDAVPAGSLAAPLPSEAGIAPRQFAQPLPVSRPSLEPSPEELAASLRRLGEAVAPPKPVEAAGLIDEMIEKGRAAR